MYNPDIKNQYVSHALEVSDSQNLLKYKRNLLNRFERSAPLEEASGKDILFMTQEEIRLFLKGFLRGGKDYQVATISMIKSYCDWGISNSISPFKENWLKDIKVSDIDISASYADSMLKDESDFLACLDTTFPDVTLDTISNIFRCVLLLIFWGVDKDDVWYLKESDMNLKARVINYKSTEINMSDALFDIVSYILRMDKITKEGKTSEYGVDIIRQGYLISNSKQYDLEEDRRKMRATYTVSLSKALSECERSLTNTTIADSGVFYRMFLNEQETGTINCLEYLRARRTQPATINAPDRVKAKCTHEYNTWKRAFNL